MTRSQALNITRGRWHRTPGTLWSLLALALLGSPVIGSAATDAELDAVREQLAEDWYYTEVVIFQRPAVMDFLSEEGLVASSVPGFPAALQSFRPAPDATGAPGRPAAHAARTLADVLNQDGCLSFPNMDPQALLQPPEQDVTASGALSGTPYGTGDDGIETDEADTASRDPASLAVPSAEPALAADPLLDFLNAVADFESDLARQSLSPLSADSLQLTSEAARIDGDRRFQVLWHGGWLQAIPERNAPAPLLVQAGQLTGPLRQLEGTLDVTLGRYLHFHARLFYHEPALGASPVDQPMAPTADPSTAVPTSSDAELLAALRPDRPAFMVLEESRRMRSGELHYLDHPKLGILVRIEPVEPPEALVEAFLALEESPQ